MEAVIFIGIQASGKSSFFRERFFDTHVRINLDMLRTRRREALLVAACLEAGQSFVVDNTNTQPSDRARHVGPARAAGFRRHPGGLAGARDGAASGAEAGSPA